MNSKTLPYGFKLSVFYKDFTKNHFKKILLFNLIEWLFYFTVFLI